MRCNFRVARVLSDKDFLVVLYEKKKRKGKLLGE
jgi:hypothetical protein